MTQPASKAIIDHLDSDGTDGTGGGSEYEETKEIFIEIFSDIAARGGTLEELINACATEVACFIAEHVRRVESRHRCHDLLV